MTKQRRVMPTMKQVREHWGMWVVEQMGDPDESPWKDEDGETKGLCYACGMYWPDCERAHIVARCNGGTDTADNLHALCRSCHKASEFREGDDYWLWLESWTLEKAMMARLAHLSPNGAVQVFADLLGALRVAEESRG